MNNNRFPRRYSFFFMFIAVVIGLSFLWNFYLFQDCMSRGNTAIQCNAAISAPNYVAVDQLN